MTTRITGLASGVDVDGYVKAEMSAYQTKVDKKQKEKETLEIKQGMYRDVITKGSEMLNKYLDIIKEGSLLSDSTYSSITFKSSDENAVNAKSMSGDAIRDNYSVKVKRLAEAPKLMFKSSTLEDMKSNGMTELKFKVGEKEVSVDIKAILDSEETNNDIKMIDLTAVLSEKLHSLDLNVIYSEIAGGVVVESKTTGENSEFTLEGTGNEELDKKYSGVDAEYEITSSYGKREGKSASNTVYFDKVKFSFKNVTDEEVKLTYKSDADKLADKLIVFFNDYNKFVEDINSYINTRHDRSYEPLTAEQKKDMSEDEIKLWNEKVKKGQLYRDNILSTLVTKLKDAMIEPLKGSNLTLKSIGIESVKDFKDKNGTFAVNKDKLVSALEEKPEEVMKLFTANKVKKGDSKVESNTKGVFTRLYGILNDTCVSSTKSALIEKAGRDSGDAKSTLTRSINEYAVKLAEMKRDLSRREQKLYNKYAKLETAMNKYNAQLGKIQSMFMS